MQPRLVTRVATGGIFPVLEQTSELARLVVEDDSLRFAIWVEKRHLTNVIEGHVRQAEMCASPRTATLEGVSPQLREAITLPRDTCVFGNTDADRVGVTLRDVAVRVRRFPPFPERNWWIVALPSRWGAVEALLLEETGATSPLEAVWASCPP
jgi:hypothetical protein